MNRQVHNLVQGSPEWHAYRATPNLFNASDAPAMLGESPYKSRDELLHEYATGIRPEVDARTQKLFDDGHRFEEEDRPRAEELIGQELFPSTVSVGFERFILSSSLDGWTMDEEIIYEHKTLNKSIEQCAANGEISLIHRIQMEQQLFCSGAVKALFRASRGSETSEPVSIWYHSDADLLGRVLNGWKQFFIDLENYVIPDSETIKPEGAVIKDLPALVVEIEGKVNSSNLAIYKDYALDFIRNVNTNLQTDQDFADAEKVVKFCERVEGELQITEKQILTQAISINEVINTIREISEEHRQTRLKLDKLIKAEKENRKNDIFKAAQNDWQKFLANCNAEIASLASVSMPQIAIDIGGAMKGKRTIETLRSAANQAVADAKISAMDEKDRIITALNTYTYDAAGYEFLFMDLQHLVMKDIDSIKAIIAQRISEHKAAEQKKIDEAAAELVRQQEQKKQADLQRQKDDEAAAIEFNNRNKAVSETLPESITTIDGSQIANQYAIKQDATFMVGSSSAMATSTVAAFSSPIDEAIRDFERLHGLVPALARSIVKAIYDGQHRHITFKN